jgi:hypothetical protein
VTSAIDPSTDLVIVASPADRLVKELELLARKSGHCPVTLTVEESARLFTVSVSEGHALVSPKIPILLRPPCPQLIRPTFDESFLFSECFATLWAAAALTDACVVNRPTVYGIGGRVSMSAALTEVRAGSEPRRVEVFSDSLPVPPAQPSCLQWYTQSAQNYETARWPTKPVGGGPYRARWLESNPAYEVVVVLRPDAWRCTLAPLEHLDLEARSISLVERLGMTFATIIWSVAHDLTGASVARVDPFPSMDQVQFVWPALGPALIKMLFGIEAAGGFDSTNSMWKASGRQNNPTSSLAK